MNRELSETSEINNSGLCGQVRREQFNRRVAPQCEKSRPTERESRHSFSFLLNSSSGAIITTKPVTEGMQCFDCLNQHGKK